MQFPAMMDANISLTKEQLFAWREVRYRLQPQHRLRNEREALEFINDVGICLLFSAKGIELPTLWGAICGEERALPQHHDDYALGLAWDWKDSIPARGEALYGKFLRGKPVFISLDLAPCFYALSENYGELDDYLEEYRAGRLSEEAKRIYEALLTTGSMTTGDLRRKCGLSAVRAAGIFDRALTELQMGYKIVKVGIADTNRWKYCYVYDLFLRRFPGIAAAARQMNQDMAAGTILTRYLHIVGAIRPSEAGRLFGWDEWRLERTIGQLSKQSRLLVGQRIAGLAGEYLISVDVFGS